MTSSDVSDTFRQESQELLEELERVLLDLEHRPADGDLIDSAFRALHTLKGSGAMFGFDRLAAFTHHVETAFDRVRKGEIKATAGLIDLTLAAKDRMRRLIEAPDEVDEASGEKILARLQDVVAGASTEAAPAEVAPAEVAPAGGKPATWRVCFRLPVGAMSSGSNPLLMIEELHDLGEATVVAQADSIPPLDELDPGECYVGWDVLLKTTASRETIEQVFLFLLDDMELSIECLEEPAEAAGAEDDPIVQSEHVPVVADAPPMEPPVPSPAEGAAAPDPAAQKAPEQAARAASAGTKSGGGSVRVPAERLDEMMDRVGELVIAQSRLKQLTKASEESQIKSVAEEIERLAGELQDITMGVRMVAIGTLFGRFRRLVHDISHDLGKDIELVTEGEETELDKTMIERLADPLVHLIRNSSDHGLETPTGRAEAGKPTKGRITLAARHAGAEVLISVRDDGRGLDRDRIQARAEENGLIAPGAKLADQDLFKLIFEPGFSTAKEVTNLSGRGVGMDVVKRTIDELRGTIDVRSQTGEGSEVTLRLPLTLAIIDGLLVRVGRSRYVIPLSAVEECVELTPEDDARSTGRSFLNIRDELVPFIRLRELFRSQVTADPYQKVVIVSAGGARVGIVVDQVLGDHQTVIKSLSKLHSDVKSFSGATILGDGTVALILDVPQLVEDGQAHDDRFKAAS